MDRLDDLNIRESTKEIGYKLYHEPKEMYRLQMIIAMMGAAYTGKTTCANAIAKSYKCSAIRFDDILDSLSPSSPPSPHEADRLIDLAFDLGLGLAKVQLVMFRPVIIDSPLAKQSHLERLLDLAGEFQKHCHDPKCMTLHFRLVIVECRPQNNYIWQLNFGNRDRQEVDRWYKPKEWKDVIFNTNSQPPKNLPDYVCRLLVDTTGHVETTNLGPATFDLCVCGKGHAVNIQNWLPNKPLHTGVRFLQPIPPSAAAADAHTTVVECGEDGRHFLEEANNSPAEASASLGSCGVCRQPISSREAYACERCKLALHKSCAELKDRTMIPPDELPLQCFRRDSIVLSDDSFPQEYRHTCPSCLAEGKEFSTSCERCLWETHLRSRLVPTILHHEGHTGGTICFWITSAMNPRNYQCEACKLPGAFVGYTCLNHTFRFTSHVECALLPRPFKHNHGGYEHDMRLVCSAQEEQEDYLCDVCQDYMNPEAWHYHCEECQFVSHLRCVHAPQST